MIVNAGLEADFQGGREYHAGGVGPVGREHRITEPFTVWEMLSRATVALDKLGVNDLTAVFVDEEEIPLEEDDESSEGDDVLPEELADAVRAAYGEGEPNSFLLMFNHEDRQFSHEITIEGFVDHPYDEAGISVLDRATANEGEEAAAAADEVEAEESYRDQSMEGADEVYEYEDIDPGGKLFDALERFMQRLQGALDGELALQEAELEIWYEDEGGSTHTPEQSSLGGNW